MFTEALEFPLRTYWQALLPVKPHHTEPLIYECLAIWGSASLPYTSSHASGAISRSSFLKASSRTKVRDVCHVILDASIKVVQNRPARLLHTLVEGARLQTLCSATGPAQDATTERRAISVIRVSNALKSRWIHASCLRTAGIVPDTSASAYPSAKSHRHEPFGRPRTVWMNRTTSVSARNGAQGVELGSDAASSPVGTPPRVTVERQLGKYRVLEKSNNLICFPSVS